jgi:hypothetical protein
MLEVNLLKEATRKKLQQIPKCQTEIEDEKLKKTR